MKLTPAYKQKVRDTILESRNRYGGSDINYAKKLGLTNSEYSKLKNGKLDRLLSDHDWLTLGRELQVKLQKDQWKTARTTVYNEIESSLNFCKELSKSLVLVDDCGIGKTFCAKHIVHKLKNTFYIDCSQAKRKSSFIKLLAKTIGVDNNGNITEVTETIKYYLNILEKPLVVLDEAGDLDYSTFLLLKELWNSTSGNCGWYMMGADGLRVKIERGVRNKKVGYAEILSRFSDEFVKLVPSGKENRQEFYKQLIGDVATVNTKNKKQVNNLIKRCLTKESSLRYLETLIKLNV